MFFDPSIQVINIFSWFSIQPNLLKIPYHCVEDATYAGTASERLWPLPPPLCSPLKNHMGGPAASILTLFLSAQSFSTKQKVWDNLLYLTSALFKETAKGRTWKGRCVATFCTFFFRCGWWQPASLHPLTSYMFPLKKSGSFWSVVQRG